MSVDWLEAGKIALSVWLVLSGIWIIVLLVQPRRKE